MKYGRTYHLPFSPGVSNDDKVFHDWESILDREIVVTEKLDGGNCCLTENGVYSRTHVAFSDSPWMAGVRQLAAPIGHMLGDLKMYGENMYAVHSIEYENIRSPFYMFAVLDGTHWLSWHDVEMYAELVGVPTVPVLARGKFSVKEFLELSSHVITEPSLLGGPKEGFVVRTVTGFDVEEFPISVLKYVRAGHVQTDVHWSRNWKKASINWRC